VPSSMSTQSVPSGVIALQEKLVLEAKKAAARKRLSVAPGPGQPCSTSIAGSLTPPPPPPPGLPLPSGLPLHLQLPSGLPYETPRREVSLEAAAMHILPASRQLPCTILQVGQELENKTPADFEPAADRLPAASEELLWLSEGSIGHPHSCKEACRYIKRKGGCRDGTSCKKCHLCFWRRAGENLEVSKENETGSGVSISIGTRGHPHTCSAACRYVRRKGGCRDGASCKQCHVCLWQREKCEGQAEEAPAEVAVSEKSSSAIFEESGKTLRELIEVMLREQALA